MGKDLEVGDQSKRIRKLLKTITAKPGKRIRLKDFDPGWTGSLVDEKDAAPLLAEGIRRLAKQQNKLYAQDTHSLLMVFQAMDAAGKDGTIQHVMSGVNPQGCQVYSFKAPSAEERDHDLPLALDEGAARARPDRHPQSVLLRGSARRARAPGDPRSRSSCRQS